MLPYQTTRFRDLAFSRPASLLSEDFSLAAQDDVRARQVSRYCTTSESCTISIERMRASIDEALNLEFRGLDPCSGPRMNWMMQKSFSNTRRSCSHGKWCATCDGINEWCGPSLARIPVLDN